MVKTKPRLRHRGVLYLEPSRAAATIGYIVVSLIALAAVTASLLYRAGQWPQTWPPSSTVSPRTTLIGAWVAGALLTVALVAAIVNGRRWRVSRTVERMSKAPGVRALMPDTTWSTQARRARSIPQLVVNDVAPRRLPKPRNLKAVSPRHNVTGRPPLRIAYLRLFENQPRARTFIQGAWREFGYVYLLRSAASVAPSELRQLERLGSTGLFIDSSSELERELDRSVGPPVSRGFHAFTNISAVTIRTWDRYGGHPPLALLCHGSYWREAVDKLLGRADVVVLDLSGFQPRNEGTGYELQRVVDRFPIERVVFLADGYSDRVFLRQMLQAAWVRMAVGSPNASQHRRTVHIAVTDYFQETVEHNAQGHETQRRVRLVARRGDTRRLAAWVQSAVAAAPPVPNEPGTDEGRLVSAAPGTTAAGSTDAGTTDGVGFGDTNGHGRLPQPPHRKRWVALALLGAAVLVAGLLVIPRLLSDDSAERVAVPNLRGLTLERADERLREAGLTLGELTRGPAPHARPNHIFGQDPPVGTKVDPSISVDVLVSTGQGPLTTPDDTPDQVTVENVVGKTSAEAMDILMGQGFLVTTAESPSEGQLDTVTDQAPEPGVSLQRGGQVTITVSTGAPATTTTPPTTGPSSTTPTS